MRLLSDFLAWLFLISWYNWYHAGLLSNNILFPDNFKPEAFLQQTLAVIIVARRLTYKNKF